MLKKLWADRYDRLFSVSEIYKSKILKACMGGALLTYFISFESWLRDPKLSAEAVENSSYLCWPYFQGCADFYFLSILPHGYSSNIFYAAMFALIAASAWGMMAGRWRLAHMLIWPLFIWKTLVVFVISTAQIVGNYEYYDLVFSFIILALPHKSFFLKFAIVWFYFLSTTVKIHPGWTIGAYFSSLKLGLPLLPDLLMPVWTNFVIIVEMVLAWFLMSRSNWWQRLALLGLVIFHVYSITLIGYRYPASVVPLLLILFGPWYKWEKTPYGWSTLGGWGLMFVIALGHFWSHVIPGDEKFTMEGNFYGLYMFEANHQCVRTVTVYSKYGEPEERKSESFKARDRCDAYKLWFQANDECKQDSNITRISAKIDHSINGGPFFRIVDEADICSVDYKPFSRNKWILDPKEGAELIGYPMKNYYYY